MSQTQANDDYSSLQNKVFSRWVQSQLITGGKDNKVENVQKDFHDGVALVELAKILTEKDTPTPWDQKGRNSFSRVQNSDLALDMFTKDGVRFIGISGKDVHDENEKLILGLVWTLILKYGIGKSVSNNESKDNNDKKVTGRSTDEMNKKALLQWNQERIQDYPNLENKPYDLTLCALLDSYFPEKVNYYQLDPNDTLNNMTVATDVMNEVGIPVFVYPEEYMNNGCKVDDKTFLTQLSTAKTVLENSSNNSSSKLNVENESEDEEDDENLQNEEENILKEAIDEENKQNKEDEERMLQESRNENPFEFVDEFEFTRNYTPEWLMNDNETTSSESQERAIDNLFEFADEFEFTRDYTPEWLMDNTSLDQESEDFDDIEECMEQKDNEEELLQEEINEEESMIKDEETQERGINDLFFGDEFEFTRNYTPEWLMNNEETTAPQPNRILIQNCLIVKCA